MKFLLPSLLRCLLLLAWSSPALAAPRLGNHDGFTRVVFDLPGPARFSSALSVGSGGARTLNVTLSRPLPSEHGPLARPGVSSYTVEGRTVTVVLAPGRTAASAGLLPAGGGQPTRLVIDVPLGPASPRTSARSQGATPRATVTPASTARPQLSVVLDPGHGGTDPGMTSSWVTEKEVTLDIALRMRELLQQQGVRVIMVRDHDTQLFADKQNDLEARSRLASAGTVNAYISIHVNSGGAAASGVETYYFGETLNPSNRSLAVFENGGGAVGQQLTRQASSSAQNLVGDLLSQTKLAFSAQLASSVQSQLVRATGAVNRGVKSDALYVIRNPTVPAILTEVGFGSNPVEGQKLAQASYRQQLAGAIAAGILRFLKVQ